MDFHICWSIDCESCRREINDTELGKRAIRGFCELLEEYGWKGSLFLIPEEIIHMPELLQEMTAAGHEIALHTHPDESGYPSGQMGVYSCDDQVRILEEAIETFHKILGTSPISARTGFCSANDSTFPALASCGIRQSSNSFPGRKMSHLTSNWAGAPLYAHYANPNNRFLEGGLNLVEIPISVDPESMIWGGIHPQDLRVEYTDAKNHGFLIRKLMHRQSTEDLPMRALLPFTHNLFDFSDKANFRRQTMQGMIEETISCANTLQLDLKGCTISEAGAIYRSVVEAAY